MITYVLSDPDTGEIRYVGCTSKLLTQRVARHLNEAFSCDKAPHSVQTWVGWLKKRGKAPFAIAVANYDCEFQVFHTLKAGGARLVNCNKPPNRDADNRSMIPPAGLVGKGRARG